METDAIYTGAVGIQGHWMEGNKATCHLLMCCCSWQTSESNTWILLHFFLMFVDIIRVKHHIAAQTEVLLEEDRGGRAAEETSPDKSHLFWRLAADVWSEAWQRGEERKADQKMEEERQRIETSGSSSSPAWSFVLFFLYQQEASLNYLLRCMHEYLHPFIQLRWTDGASHGYITAILNLTAILNAISVQ